MSFELTRPMLAGKGSIMDIHYPVAVTPKIDGIRCLIIDGVPVSRTLKPIRNLRIRETLSGIPHLLDGELIARDGNFQQSTSAVMSADSTIPFEYWVFDLIDQSSSQPLPYSSRMQQLKELYDTGVLPKEVRIVLPDYVYEREHLEELHQAHIEDGFEGSMCRRPDGTYKCGRSTVREQLLLKLKQFDDAEAVVTGVEPLFHNANEATTNALGLTERSSHKDNKIQSESLGALIVHLLDDPKVQFKIGTGFTQEQRETLWQERESLVGRIAKFKFFNQGIKVSPRHPVWLGWRDIEDM